MNLVLVECRLQHSVLLDAGCYNKPPNLLAFLPTRVFLHQLSCKNGTRWEQQNNGGGLFSIWGRHQHMADSSALLGLTEHFCLQVCYSEITSRGITEPFIFQMVNCFPVQLLLFLDGERFRSLSLGTSWMYINSEFLSILDNSFCHFPAKYMQTKGLMQRRKGYTPLWRVSFCCTKKPLEISGIFVRGRICLLLILSIGSLWEDAAVIPGTSRYNRKLGNFQLAWS